MTTTPVLNQIEFRGRRDDVGLNVNTFNNPTGGTNLALNTNWTQDTGVNFRVRMTIRETANGSSMNNAFRMMFNLAGGGYTAVTATSAIQWATSGQYTDSDATSQLFGAESFVAGIGNSGDATTTNITLQSNDTECEWCLQVDAAQVTNGQTFLLRVYTGDGATPLTTYTNTPTVTINEVTIINFTGTPADGTIGVAGQTPSLTIGNTLSPTIGVATLEGQAATVAASATVAPSASIATFAGLAPAVSTGGGLVQRLSPNEIVSSTNLKDTLSNIPPTRLADIDDETAGSPGPDTEWFTAVNPNADIDILLGFPTAPGNLVGTQTINVLIRGTSLPSRDWRLDLYENGSPAPGSPTIFASGTTSSVSGQVVSFTFQPGDIVGATGAGVQVRIRGTA